MIARIRQGLIHLNVVVAFLTFSSGASGYVASALGPEATLSEPSGGYVGQMTVIPAHAPAGTRVTVKANGLPSRQEVQLVWRTVKGQWKVVDGDYNGREYIPVVYEIAKLTTDVNGALDFEFETPEDFGFMHDIVVQQGQRLLTQVGFNLDMTVSISPARAPAGTPITIEVKGIGWRQLQNSWMLLYDNKYTGWISAVTTSGAARFTVPAVGRPGRHVLEILHGDFTFAYRNMQQSPEPDRPRFIKYLTVTPGAAVLPPPAELQTQKNIRGLPKPGALVATPAHAPIKTPVVVRGAGIPPGKPFDLEWGTVTGNRVSANAGWEESTRAIASAIADTQGNIEFRFNAPDDLGGAHSLLVRDGTLKKQGFFWTVPSALPLNVNKGPVGTAFKVHLKGAGWTETANIYAIVYDNNYIGYACGFNSQGDIEVFLQATGDPGWHFIDFYPAIYKGKETRPLNFRVPQLTFEADHPGEDLPRFRFAFLVTPDLKAKAAP